MPCMRHAQLWYKRHAACSELILEAKRRALAAKEQQAAEQLEQLEAARKAATKAKATEKTARAELDMQSVQQRNEQDQLQRARYFQVHRVT